MKRNRLWWLVLPILGFSTVTCTHEYVEDIRGVCFERDVLPIFQSNCTQSGCHNSQDRESGYDLTSYENIVRKGITPGNYRTSQIYKVLVSVATPMPQSPYSRLNDAQITNISLWIQDGALNTTCNDSSACNTSNVTYNATIVPILQTYCYGCHAGSSPQGNVNYNTYAGVKTTVTNGKLIGSVQHKIGRAHV